MTEILKRRIEILTLSCCCHRLWCLCLYRWSIFRYQSPLLFVHMLYYLRVIHNHRDIGKQKNCLPSERKSACTDYWFVDKCFLFDFQVGRRSLLLSSNEESETSSALTVLDILLILVSLTNVSATVFDDIVPGWAKSETVCQALLTRWADYQTNFTGFTAILGKSNKKSERVLRRIRKLLKEEKKVKRWQRKWDFSCCRMLKRHFNFHYSP